MTSGHMQDQRVSRVRAMQFAACGLKAGSVVGNGYQVPAELFSLADQLRALRGCLVLWARAASLIEAVESAHWDIASAGGGRRGADHVHSLD